MKHALAIFVKNVIPGKVKTRLAATMGEAGAMDVYKTLLQVTHHATVSLRLYKSVYYAGYIEKEDLWTHGDFEKKLQRGAGLGERMRHAIAAELKSGHQTVVLIGSDCPEITKEIIERAFAALTEISVDVVIGPAGDGGYYLIGMKRVHEALFTGIAWSTSTVLARTLQKCDELGLRYVLLPLLHDIDEPGDLIHLKKSTGD